MHDASSPRWLGLHGNHAAAQHTPRTTDGRKELPFRPTVGVRATLRSSALPSPPHTVRDAPSRLP
jgi:hypothetical protein